MSQEKQRKLVQNNMTKNNALPTEVLCEILILLLPEENDTDKEVAEEFALGLREIYCTVGRDTERFTRYLHFLRRTGECKGRPSWKKVSHHSKRIQDHLDVIDELKEDK